MRPHYWDYDTNGLDHYFTVKQLAVPMTLYLYNYDFSSQTVESNLVAWEPTTPQWWITGFNPEHVGRVDANMEVLIGRVDFSENEDLYCQLKNTTNEEYINIYNVAAAKYLIFDDNNHYVWVNWYLEG